MADSTFATDSDRRRNVRSGTMGLGAKRASMRTNRISIAAAAASVVIVRDDPGVGAGADDAVHEEGHAAGKSGGASEVQAAAR